MADPGARPQRSPRALAICVDDFGLHEGVNRAVVTLAERARISTVSCMVGAPAWSAGSATLRGLDARMLDVGLHFDLTEHPIDCGLRRGIGRWYALGAIAAVDRSRVRAEFVAQLAIFERALGRPPTHVDGHQHVHQFPLVREVLVEVLLQRYPGSLPWLRSTRRAPTAHGFDKAWLIERMGCDGLARLAQAHGFAQNASLLGVYDFSGSAEAYQSLLAQWLAVAQSGDLLMCHPAQAAAAHDAILAARVREHEVLVSDEFGLLLARSGLHVAPLRAAAHPAPG